MDRKEIGDRIREVRTALGLSQHAFGEGIHLFLFLIIHDSKIKCKSHYFYLS